MPTPPQPPLATGPKDNVLDVNNQTDHHNYGQSWMGRILEKLDDLYSLSQKGNVFAKIGDQNVSDLAAAINDKMDAIGQNLVLMKAEFLTVLTRQEKSLGEMAESLDKIMDALDKQETAAQVRHRELLDAINGKH